MAKRVILDAMIRRADFAQQAESQNIELGDKIGIESVSGNKPFLKLMRKPDFQRETNHWSPEQVAALVKSFADGELIPSLILWKSQSFIFVIDGGHRLSALRAWVENDYGAGSISYDFFGGKIQDEQKKIADRTKRLVEREVGRYADFLKMSDEQLNAGTQQAKRASTIFSRSLHVQWIQGNHEVAEASFFKINSQGTALDTVEELLLRNRKKSYAIAARSVVRSGSGHKYWSSFDNQTQENIEQNSEFIHRMLFEPDLRQPIKTLDLPLGGTSSPVDALKMLVDIFATVDGSREPEKTIKELLEDESGSETIGILKRAKRVISRVTGNDAGSLGLHPAVYFYTERGKHSRFLFLGAIKAISGAIRSNDKAWFKRFTSIRGTMEDILVSRKSLINQGLANINSKQRIDRVSNLIEGLKDVLSKGEEVDDQKILNLLGLKGNMGDLQIIDAPAGFSDDVKSAVFLKNSLAASARCSICGGYIDYAKSASYDHIEPIRVGGRGTEGNAQILHPFCNSGVKS